MLKGALEAEGKLFNNKCDEESSETEAFDQLIGSYSDMVLAATKLTEENKVTKNNVFEMNNINIVNVGRHKKDYIFS